VLHNHIPELLAFVVVVAVVAHKLVGIHATEVVVVAAAAAAADTGVAAEADHSYNQGCHYLDTVVAERSLGPASGSNRIHYSPH